jgi:hypothetical protein
MHTTDLNVFLSRAFMHTNEFHEMRFWPRDEHQSMYAISLLKQVVVVLCKSEGLQKWLTPCGTDMHRVARTINDCFLKKDSHSIKLKIMRTEVLRAQEMENLGAISVCLLEQLRPSWRKWTFVTYYSIKAAVSNHATHSWQIKQGCVQKNSGSSDPVIPGIF